MKKEINTSLSECFSSDEIKLLRVTVAMLKSKDSTAAICGLMMMIDKSSEFSDHVNLCINSLGRVLSEHGDLDVLKQSLEGIMHCYKILEDEK